MWIQEIRIALSNPFREDSTARSTRIDPLWLDRFGDGRSPVLSQALRIFPAYLRVRPGLSGGVAIGHNGGGLSEGDRIS
jgi:hypothetical protein